MILKDLFFLIKKSKFDWLENLVFIILVMTMNQRDNSEKVTFRSLIFFYLFLYE